MSNHKNLADLLKVCSILPALAIMPAMASEYAVVPETLISEVKTISENGAWQDASTTSGNQSVWWIKGGDVTVASGVSFSNNKADSGIFSTSTEAPSSLVLNSGVVFENNTVRFDGGAVANYDTLNADGVTFRKNTAQTDFENDTTPMGGGALALGSESQTVVRDSLFVQNESKYHGGAVAMRGPKDGDNSAADLDIIDSEFNGNIATQNGGAIYSTFYDSEQVKDSVYIEGTDFVANSANKGGAIYNEGVADKSDNLASMKVVDSDFVGNTATANGGAIYNASGMTIEDSEFSKNSVTAGDGGAIRIDVVNGNKTVIKDSEFSENKALGYSQADSGAISVRNGDVEISGTDFDKNEAKFGGAMYLYSGNNHHVVVDVTDSEFSENSALSGGAIVNIASNKNNEKGGLRLTDVTLSTNKATSADSSGGGALFLGAQSQTFITRGTFSGNTSAATGGAISMRDVDSGNNKDAKLDIIDSVFSGNTAATNGGAIYSTFYDSENVRDSVYVKGTDFSGNSAERGGAIYTEGQADLGGGLASMKVEGATFTGNTVSSLGGAVYNASNMDIVNATFSGNSSDYVAGALWAAKNSTTTISGATFDNNTALWGGALYSSYTNTNLTISDSVFKNNSALGTGAAGLFNKATLTDVRFENNQATDATDDGGGAVFLGSLAQVQMTNATFSDNTSASVGGGIAMRAASEGNNTAAKLDVVDSVFSGNTAGTQGGAIFSTFYNSESAVDNVYVKGTQFVNNTAAEGGAIYNEGLADRGGNFAAMKLENVSFVDNVATTNGGAIYNGVDGTVNLAGENTFSGNTAGSYGALNDIHNLGTLNVTDGTTTFGGGVSGNGTFTLAEGATLNIGTSTISQGTIDLGGTVIASALNSRDFGRFRGMVSVGENAKFELNVGAVGTYNIWDGATVAAEQVSVGDIYEITGIDANGITVATKAVEDIAANAGISTQAAGAVAGLANATSGKAHQVSLALQKALNSGDATFVETESKKLNPTDKPITHALASSVQNQVLSLTSGRMAGAISVGRAGGDEVAQENGFWMQGLFNKSKLAGEFPGDPRGLALGADTLIDKKWTVGGGLAFNNSDVHADAVHTDIDSKTLFLYGQYKPNKWYVNGTLTYNMSEYTDTKTVAGVSASAEYDVDSYGAQVMTGYDFATGITTEAGLRYLHVAQDGYSDGFGLTSVKAMDTDFLSGVAGVKYAFAIENDWAIQLRPELRAAMTYDFISDDAMATVIMPSVASYKVAVDRLSRMGGEFGIGLTALYKGMEFSIVYDLDLHKDYTSQTGMIKFRTQF